MPADLETCQACGGAAKFGLNVQWGLELAADEINALGGATVGGKKYKVRVVSMDDRFQAADYRQAIPAGSNARGNEVTKEARLDSRCYGS